jgi:hypothetical protein
MRISFWNGQWNRALLGVLGAGTAMTSASCLHVSSDPIEVKPIHVVVDVNVRVDRQLDEFFAFEQKYQQPTSATQPSASSLSPPRTTQSVASDVKTIEQ